MSIVYVAFYPSDWLAGTRGLSAEGGQQDAVPPEKDNWKPIGDLVREVVRKAGKHG